MREAGQIALLFAITFAMGLLGVALVPSELSPSPELAAVLFVLGTPFLFVLLYRVHGREQDVTVPEYLSGVPNPDRKPWVVNLVFRGDSFESTDDGFYATVLDLQRRGFVAFGAEEPGGDVRIRVLKDRSDDSYEQNVLSFLGFIGEAKIPDRERIGHLLTSVLDRRDSLPGLVAAIAIRRIRGGAGSGHFSLGALIRPPEDVVNRFFENGRSRVLPVLFAAAGFYLLAMLLAVMRGETDILAAYRGLLTAIFCFFLFLALLRGSKEEGWVGQAKSLAMIIILVSIVTGFVLPAVMAGETTTPQFLMYVVGFQCLATLLFPPTLLGRWKAEAYREKLQWGAFRAFLSDLVKIQEYSQADQAMWGDWLVYGTALGVGDGLVAAMGDLRVQFPAAEMSRVIQAAVLKYAEVASDGEDTLHGVGLG